MKKCIGFFFCCLINVTLSLHAQQSEEYKDIIYLKNGSKLYCKLLDYKPGDSITFALKGMSPMKLGDNMIKKVKMNGFEGYSDVYRIKENKWYLRTQFSMLYNKKHNGLSLTQSVGYQFKHWFSAGVGAGIDNYYTNRGNNMFPLFVEVRSYLFQKNVSPFFACRTGYNFIKPNADYNQTSAVGAFFINPVFGYRLGAGSPTFDLFCGIKIQKAEYHVRDFWSSSIVNYDFRRYDIGLAMTF